jgi:hypothetical protein
VLGVRSLSRTVSAVATATSTAVEAAMPTISVSAAADQVDSVESADPVIARC